MTATTDRPTTDSGNIVCPAWCHDHTSDDDGAVLHTSWPQTFESIDGQPCYLYLSLMDQANGEGLEGEPVCLSIGDRLVPVDEGKMLIESLKWLLRRAEAPATDTESYAVARRVRRATQEAGMSMLRLEDMTGMSGNKLMHRLDGASSFTVDVLSRIAWAIDASVADFFKKDEG